MHLCYQYSIWCVFTFISKHIYLKERGIISLDYNITACTLLQETQQVHRIGREASPARTQWHRQRGQHITTYTGRKTSARLTHSTTGHDTRRGRCHRQHRHGTVCVGVKLTGTESGGAIINRDRRKWEGSLKGVHVTTHTAWHAPAVTLRTSAIKTTCPSHSLVDGHLGYNHGVGWDERKSGS